MKHLWIVLLAACGGQKVISPSVPRAEVSCAGCSDGKIFAVGSKLSIMSTWSGTCEDENPRIGVEGGSPPVTCNEHRFKTTVLSCDPACTVDGAAGFTLPQPGDYVVHVRFTPDDGAAAKTLKLPARAVAIADAVVTCELTADKSFVDVGFRSSTGAQVAANVPTVTIQGTACEHAEFGSDAERYTCPVHADMIDVEIATGTFSRKKTVVCAAR